MLWSCTELHAVTAGMCMLYGTTRHGPLLHVLFLPTFVVMLEEWAPTLVVLFLSLTIYSVTETILRWILMHQNRELTW